MTPHPKPTKGSQKKQKEERRRLLSALRQQQAYLAIARDNGLCAIHWFVHCKEVPFDDVHHVYGRGRATTSWREDHSNLLCVCRSCHPQPIQTPGGSKDLGWVEEVLLKANNAPINDRFKVAYLGEEEDS